VYISGICESDRDTAIIQSVNPQSKLRTLTSVVVGNGRSSNSNVDIMYTFHTNNAAFRIQASNIDWSIVICSTFHSTVVFTFWFTRDVNKTFFKTKATSRFVEKSRDQDPKLQVYTSVQFHYIYTTRRRRRGLDWDGCVHPTLMRYRWASWGEYGCTIRARYISSCFP